MKRSLVILLTAASISAMTVGTVAPVWAETNVEADAEETADKAEDAEDAELEDGVYGVKFDTDSGMFHENPDYNDGKATLTVKDGKMTVHITLNSKNIVQLFLGSAEDAQKDGADLIDPSETTEITYSDGSAPKEVYSFDVPVPTLDDEFDLALIGTKGKWYDHKVSVSNPEAVQ